MKKVLVKLITLAALTALASACGSQNSQSIPYPTNPLYPNCVTNNTCTSSVTSYGTGTLPTFTTGDTEPFTPVSNSVLSQYVGYPLQNPGSVEVNLAFTPSTTQYPVSGGASQVYLGTMHIAFVDNGTTVHNGSFSNNSDPNQPYKSDKTYYNNVSTLMNGSTYRIFVEDPAGALVVTIKSVAGTDTGATASGQIWFYNFPNTGAPNPLFSGAYDQYGNYFPPGEVFCWEIDLGPYDCQNWGVPPSTSNNGVPGFVLLGNIPAINIHNALGI